MKTRLQTSDLDIIETKDENGKDIVSVRIKLCGAKYIERSLSGKKSGEEFYCERPLNHLPSERHLNRKHKAVWYRDHNDL